MKKLTHINQKGDAQLVDITEKAITHRKAIAEGTIQLNKDTLKLIQANLIKKGDVLNTAKIAGIQAAKKTWELIPLCHSINLTKIDIEFNNNYSQKKSHPKGDFLIFVVPAIGFELMTYRLQGGCSTN